MPQAYTYGPPVIITGGGGGPSTAGADIFIGPGYGTEPSRITCYINSAHTNTFQFVRTVLESQFNDVLLEQRYRTAVESQFNDVLLEQRYPAMVQEIKCSGSVNVSAMPASQDTWIGRAQVAGVCLDAANHNSTTLKISGAAGDNDAAAFISFLLPGFATTATVTITAATLHLTCVTAPAAAHDYRLVRLASSSTWSEGTLVCSNAPPLAGGTQTYTQANTTGAVTIPVASTHLPGIAACIGTTRQCTFVIVDSATVLGSSVVYQSKDLSVADGPFLSFTYTCT